MDREALYNELIQSEPLGFIDPFSDLGEFDPLQLKFKQPVKDLVNRYSGQPYSLAWQHKIMEMRKLFIDYQIALNEEDKQINFQRRTRSEESKEHATTIVTTYLKLGFSFLEGFYQSEDPFIQTTKKEIREKLNIPERSLDKVLKVLKTEQKIFFTVKHGRGGGIRLASIKAIFLSLIKVKKERQEAYMANIAAFFEESIEFTQRVIERVKDGFKQTQQLSLFELDIG